MTIWQLAARAAATFWVTPALWPAVFRHQSGQAVVSQHGLLNRAFLMLAMSAGLDSAIMDPLDTPIMAEVVAAETLPGKDEWCASYIAHSRAGCLR